MANGIVSQINPPAPNSSWHLDFIGPTLVCIPLNDSMHLRVRQSMTAYLKSSYGREEDYVVGTNVYTYLGWYPQRVNYPQLDWAADAPFQPTNENATSFQDSGNSTNYTLDVGSFTTSFNMFAASRPMIESYHAEASQVDGGANTNQLEVITKASSTLDPDWRLDGTALQCTLRNSTYNVSFDYADGFQEISISTSIFQEQEQIDPVPVAAGPHEDTVRLNKTTECNIEPEDVDMPCVLHAQTLQRLSYQALMDAFTRNLQGTVYYSGFSRQTRNSSLENTVLFNTPELFFLPDDGGWRKRGDGTLRNVLTRLNASALPNLTNSYNGSLQLPLGAAVEELFRNFTVSLMASPALQ